MTDAPWHFSWTYEAKDRSAISKKAWSELTANQREERLGLLTDAQEFLIFENLRKSDAPTVQQLVAASTGPDMFRLIHAARRGLPLAKLTLEQLRGVDIDRVADGLKRLENGEAVAPIVPLRPEQIPPYAPVPLPKPFPNIKRKHGRALEEISDERRAYIENRVSVSDRPWSVLAPSQKVQRLDKLGAWHERDIFEKDIGQHKISRVRYHAKMSTEADMILLVKAFKGGIPLEKYSLADLRVLDLDREIARIVKKQKGTKAQPEPLYPESPAPQPAPAPIAAKSEPAESDPAEQDLRAFEKSLLDIASKVSGIKPKAVSAALPPKPEPRERPLGSPLYRPQEAAQERQERVVASPRPVIPPDPESSSQPPPSGQQRATAADMAAEAIGLKSDADEDAKTITRAKFPGYTKAEIAAIRQALVIGGRTRLDLEAISAYMLVPSYFAIATGLDPCWWQAALLDSYDRRIGCLAARQSGKSLVTARKATAFALCNPGSTSLIIAPTLRQSSELLLKCAGVAQVAGLRLASLSQFQVVIADKQAGASSRIISLPGGNEDAGASVRGYAADLLIFEEAAFLQDPVISAVLPSIAARPKAQLVGISSAGIIGSYFHSVMTAAGSRWTKLVVPAPESDRFTKQQLEEMKITLGARYGVEMLCKWGTVGDSLYSEDVFDLAFGTTIDGVPHEAALDPDLAFGHLDLENIFAARPFEKNLMGASMR